MYLLAWVGAAVTAAPSQSLEIEVDEGSVKVVPAAEGLLLGMEPGCFVEVPGVLPDGVSLTTGGELQVVGPRGGNDSAEFFVTVLRKSEPGFAIRRGVVVRLRAVNDPPATPILAGSIPTGQLTTIVYPEFDDWEQFPDAPPPQVVFNNTAELSFDTSVRGSVGVTVVGAIAPGRYSSTYAVTDHKGLTSTGPVDIYYKTDGVAPSPQSETVTVNEESDTILPLTIPVDHRVVLFDRGSGSAIVEGSKIRFVARRNVFGVETFTYVVTNGLYFGGPATVTVNVSNTPDPPVLVDDIEPIKLKLQTPLTLDPLSFVEDPDLDKLSVSNVSAPATVTVASIAGSQIYILTATGALADGARLEFDVTDAPGQAPTRLSIPLGLDVAGVLTARGWCDQYSAAAASTSSVPTHRVCYDTAVAQRYIARESPENTGSDKMYSREAFLEVAIRSDPVRIQADSALRPTLRVISDQEGVTPIISGRYAIEDGTEVIVYKVDPRQPEEQIKFIVDGMQKPQRIDVQAVEWPVFQEDGFRYRQLAPTLTPEEVAPQWQQLSFAPESIMLAGVDGTSLQAVTDLISLDWAVHVGVRGTLLVTEGEAGDPAISLFSIPATSSASDAFRAFTYGTGVYVQVPLLANDWGRRAYGPEIDRNYSVSGGVRVGLDPSRGDDVNPYNEVYTLGKFNYSVRSATGDLSGGIGGYVRLGTARASNEFRQQLCIESDGSICPRAKVPSKAFAYAVIGAKVYSGAGVQFGAEFYVPPGSVGPVLPSITLTYGG